MLSVIQRFGKHCSWHLQDEYVHSQHITLKMATAVFAETLDNTQHSTRLNPES
jgi:hypothetical protein